MEYPTAFWQELYVALQGNELCEPEEFTIVVTETHDSENYRIERHLRGNAIYFWQGNDWPTVLKDCIDSNQPPF